ncbi:MAG: hypothetical protein WA610_08120 [Thermodesulfovibrionales bacterium]
MKIRSIPLSGIADAMSLRDSSPGKRARLFQLAVLWLSGLSLWPVWRFRFPAMQDYPHHLFISYVLATFNDPSFDWTRHYVVDLKADPYNLYYFITGFFQLFCDIETSGKLFISVYLLLVALLVIKASRPFDKQQAPPWGLLLLFPFSFSQVYFLGLTNYLISIPLLFLALIDLERLISRPFTAGSVFQHSMYQLLLFISHPYSVLLYLAFAFTGSLFSLSERRNFRKAFFIPLVLALLFFYWYSGAQGPVAVDTGGQSVPSDIRWVSVEERLGFYLLMFTGMRWTTGIDWSTTLVWLATLGLFFISGTVNWKNIVIPWKAVSFLFLSLLVFALMPFTLAITYFNLRIAPVSYFFISIILARMKLGGKAALSLVVLVTLLMVFSSNLQGRLSRESAEIMPLLVRMEGNAAVLPVILDSSSKELDPVFFEFHEHHANYYHIIAGGGVTPTLWQNPLFPVHYKPGVALPVPSDLSPSSLGAYASHYKYLLVRGAPPIYIGDLSHYYNFVARSGAWSLFRSPVL